MKHNTNNLSNNTVKSLIKNHIKEFYIMCGDDLSHSALYHSTIMMVEEALIEETLKYTDGVQATAAKLLGINRNTLRKKIEQLGIRKNDGQ